MSDMSLTLLGLVLIVSSISCRASSMDEATQGLYQAIISDSEKIEYYIKQGADINWQLDPYDPPIVQAVRLHRIEATKHLVRLGANINIPGRWGRRAIHYATDHFRFGDREYLMLLLDAGADVNVYDDRGWSPLHYAEAYESMDEVAAILKKHEAKNKLFNLAKLRNTIKRLFTYVSH